jgi:hypothetical protein
MLLLGLMVVRMFADARPSVEWVERVELPAVPDAWIIESARLPRRPAVIGADRPSGRPPRS